MKNDKVDISNYYEVENEIQYYDIAFPSLTSKQINSDASIENSKKLISISKNDPELNSAITQKSTRSFQHITDSFVIPFEERKHVDLDSSKLKKLLFDICTNCEVRVETNVTLNQSLSVIIIGQRNMVLEAKKLVLRVLQNQFKISLEIPKEFHRHLIGYKGAIHKEMENESSTQISFPKYEESSNLIEIKGSRDATLHAKQLVLKIVDEVEKVGRQVIEIDKRYHQLVCSKHNTALHAILERKKLRLDIPPFTVDKNEISISGQRDDVAQVASILNQSYDHMKSTYQELQISIPKEKHRFIIGPKGSGIKEILDKTNVWVEINESKSNSDSADTITLLGPKESLGPALTMVFIKSESIKVTAVDAPGWLHKFLIGKSGSNLVELSKNKPNIHLSFESELNQIIVEGPPDEVAEVSQNLKDKIFDFQSRLSQVEIEIDPTAVKRVLESDEFIIQRIRKKTNCSIIFPFNPANRLVIIIGTPDGTEEAKQMLLNTIEKIENTKKKDVIFKHSFFPQLIGKSGKGLKEIIDKYPEIKITFPAAEENKDIITIVGPRKDVDQVAILLQKKHASLVESSYSEKIKIPYKYHKNIIGRDGTIIKKLIEATNTKFAFPSSNEQKDEISITGKMSDVQNAIAKVKSIYEKESSIIEQEINISKNLHTIMIGKGGSRIKAVKESFDSPLIIKFPNPEDESSIVKVKGFKDDVFKAQIKLQNLVEEITSANYEEYFRLTSEEHEFLFMSRDLKFNKLREKFLVKFFDSKDEGDTLVKIVGQKENVLKALNELELAKSEMGPIKTDTLKLAVNDLKYFQESKELVRIGRDHSCKLSGLIQKSENNSDVQGILSLQGPMKNINAAKNEILEIMEEYENTVTELLIVDAKQLANIEWYSQTDLAEICKKYKLQIHFLFNPEPTENNNTLPCQPSSKLNDKHYTNGIDSSYSEEESATNSNHNSKSNDFSEINSDVSSTISAGVDLTRENVAKIQLPKYKIALTGHKNKIPLAKEDIINLFVVDLEVNVPEKYYPALIGTKGDNIKKLRTNHQVDIIIPSKNTKSKMVIVSGKSEKAVAAKKEILEFVQDLDQKKYEREIKNFQLTISIPSQYHGRLIGNKGEFINKFRTKHTVKISFPSPDSHTDEITVQGHKDNVQKAGDEILAVVQKWTSGFIEELNIDSTIHGLLIGARGAKLDLLKKKYEVEIIFPSRGTLESEGGNIVKVKGSKENVDKCCDELIDRANEMMNEISEQRQLSPVKNFEPEKTDQNLQQEGFHILNAPWDNINGLTIIDHNNVAAVPNTCWKNILSKSKTDQ